MPLTIRPGALLALCLLTILILPTLPIGGCSPYLLILELVGAVLVDVAGLVSVLAPVGGWSWVLPLNLVVAGTPLVLAFAKRSEQFRFGRFAAVYLAMYTALWLLRVPCRFIDFP